MKNYIFTPKGLFYGKAKKYKLKKILRQYIKMKKDNHKIC